MIKVFSPEAFRDYAIDSVYYNCISEVKETRWYIQHSTLNKIFKYDYRSVITSRYSTIDEFLTVMNTAGDIIKGDKQSEIINYDNFVSGLRTLFNISAMADWYVDLRYFRNFLDQEGFSKLDSFINDLCNSKVISNYEGRARINNLTYFIDALKNNYKLTNDQITAMLNDEDSGIFQDEGRHSALYYSFILCEANIPSYKLDGHNTYIYSKTGKMYDTGDLYEYLNDGVLLGYDLFGIYGEVLDAAYFQYNKFYSYITAKLHSGMSPTAFLRDLLNRGIVVAVGSRYRIVNLDNFRTSYSLYCIGINLGDYNVNGDVIVLPTNGTNTVEINGNWELTFTCVLDEDGYSNYIQKGCIIELPFKMAREQVYPFQLYRVYEVVRNIDSIQVVAYPICQEAQFECPVNSIYLENVDAKGAANTLTNLYPEKYSVETDISNGVASIYAENTNLQAILAGTDDATFINAFGGDIIYDNYVYRIQKECGKGYDNKDDYLIQYGSNLKGISITENTFDIVTRVYPVSQEGYDLNTVEAQMQLYTKLYGDYTDRLISGFYFCLNDMANAVEKFDKENKGSKTLIGLTKQFSADDQQLEGAKTSSFTAEAGVVTNSTEDFKKFGASDKNKKECCNFVLSLYDEGKCTLQNKSGATLTRQALVDIMSQTGIAFNLTNFYVHLVIDGELKYISMYESDFRNFVGNWGYPDSFTRKLETLRVGMSAGLFVKTQYKKVSVSNTNLPKYVDSDNISEYPFVHARSISYNIPLLESEPEDSKSELTESQRILKQAKDTIKAKTAELSKKYIKMAHKGDWNNKKRIKMKDTKKELDPNTHMHTKPYYQRRDRVALPYGYILYSFKDTIEYLKNQCVLSWCSNESEAEAFCEAIEEGFAWCEKTNIAKWAWHNNGSGQYYGTKKKGSDDWNGIKYGYHKIGNVMYWFTDSGYIKKKLLKYDDYKWVETEVTFTEEEQEAINEQKKAEKEADTYDEYKYKVYPYKKFQYMDSDGNMMKNCWIEDSVNKHYFVNADGYRTIEDPEEWTFRPGIDGNTFRLTGWQYGNFEKGYLPSNQYMFIKDRQAWFRYSTPGTIQGNYLSKANWSWKKYKKGWRYTDGKHSYFWGQWAKIDGKWYFFNHNGYADETTDDFVDNAKAFNTTNKHPETDYNREGVGSVSSSSDITTSTEQSFDADRDGVVAWAQTQFIKDLTKTILNQHYAVWDDLRSRLWNAACDDILTLRNEAISVEIDFEDLRKYSGYEELTFLEDLYLGDYVHVKSSVHNYDGYLRVVSLSVDVTTGLKSSMTLGYPVNSFIKRTAKLNSSGSVKFYQPVSNINDGYGANISSGYIDDPYISTN